MKSSLNSAHSTCGVSLTSLSVGGSVAWSCRASQLSRRSGVGQRTSSLLAWAWARSSNDFQLSSQLKTTKSSSQQQQQQQQQLYMPVNPVPAAELSHPAFVPTVLGAAFLAILAYKSAWLLEKLPWSKHNQDLQVINAIKAMENDLLSEEAVTAARARRSKERANHKLSLEDVDLPDNHPWATKQKVSKEQENAVHTRLNLRRSVPRIVPPPHQPHGPAVRGGWLVSDSS